MNLKFHWRLLQGGETPNMTRAIEGMRRETGLPDLERQAEFCRRAEQCGIIGLLTDIGATKPDPILLSAALGLATEKIEFIVAYRSGLIPPTTFVQQLNTLSSLIQGRLSLNIVAGHSPVEQRYYGDFLSHDERYPRTEEFLAICHAFWREDGPVNFRGKYYRIEEGQLNTPFVSKAGTSPYIFIGGGSEAARALSISQGSCWIRLADTPANLLVGSKSVLDAGKELGVRVGVICRPTREEAIDAARALVASLDPAMREKEQEREFASRSDSVSLRQIYKMAEEDWPTPWLWTGAVRSHGGAAIAIVGSPEEVASAFIEYGRIGVTQFIISGWPKLEEMIIFGRDVLPLIRQKESALNEAGATTNHDHYREFARPV
ncbi:MAG TPA: LLM class flavin-dependent oxidoreductase [Chthoniobacterales bacterium]|nr:LLM class flavin-dependent oxidoreductase [Chthoniobacterales bacterium]